MFSGIVKGVGRIVEQADTGGDRRFAIAFDGTPLPPPKIGGSVAVNGVCLTATSVGASQFTADVSAETLRVTTLGQLAPGARVNLESPLTLADGLDGHLVTGHVDGIGEVVDVTPAARSQAITIAVPAELARYIAKKGSVAVDGVSLTVNSVEGARLTVNVIPHTLEVTVIGEYRPGSAVNIEVDLIARYLERLLPDAAQPRGSDADQ